MTKQIIVKASQIEEVLQMDYKTLDYMLLSKTAEEFDSAKSLFNDRDAKDCYSEASIEAAKAPLYVIHDFEGTVFEYTPVYDASLNLVGFLD